MYIKNEGHPPSPQTDCRRTRLARTKVAAIDVCDCQIMQIHVGALTLRMTPDAVGDLLSALNQALAAHAAREASTASSFAFGPAPLGQA